MVWAIDVASLMYIGPARETYTLKSFTKELYLAILEPFPGFTRFVSVSTSWTATS
jgi:hypothetical protein